MLIHALFDMYFKLLHYPVCHCTATCPVHAHAQTTRAPAPEGSRVDIWYYCVRGPNEALASFPDVQTAFEMVIGV